MNCESGLIYNALTTTCEKGNNRVLFLIEKLFYCKIINFFPGPCTFDSTLCKNEGQCIDEPTNEKSFKCICWSHFQGDFCEQGK